MLSNNIYWNNLVFIIIWTVLLGLCKTFLGAGLLRCLLLIILYSVVLITIIIRVKNGTKLNSIFYIILFISYLLGLLMSLGLVFNFFLRLDIIRILGLTLAQVVFGLILTSSLLKYKEVNYRASTVVLLVILVLPILPLDFTIFGVKLIDFWPISSWIGLLLYSLVITRMEIKVISLYMMITFATSLINVLAR